MNPVALACLPAGAGVFGAAVAVRRPPSPRVTSTLQHLAAGVVIAVVAMELLPDIVHSGARWHATLGFTIGVALMLSVRAGAIWFEHRRKAAGGAAEATSLGMVVATGIDLAIDGLLVGVSTTLGGEQGLLVSIALALEMLALSSALAAEVVENGGTRTRAVAAVSALLVLLPVGALAGSTVLRDASPGLLAATLAFGAAALLYLAMEELLAEAHEVPETPFMTAMFFVGFLVVFLLEWV